MSEYPASTPIAPRIAYREVSPAEFFDSIRDMVLPPHAYEHKPADGPIQIKPYGLRHCVICRSHNRGQKFWESYVGRKGERRVVWCKRPICSGCGSPWVSVLCEGGHK